MHKPHLDKPDISKHLDGLLDKVTDMKSLFEQLTDELLAEHYKQLQREQIADAFGSRD